MVSAGNYTDDIDDQGTFNNTHSTIETANNYGYDELGNLVRDVQEEIASIKWTVYGKMKKITRNSGSSKADLEFGYDASGNRLWKKVTPKGSGAVTSTYYYLRDAQGNEMCRYVKYTNTNSQLMYVAQEHSIYGSSRVGVDGRKDTLYKAGSYSPAWGGANTSRRALGLKSFELANHLGNVLVTVSDKPVYKVSSGTIYFQPEVSSISDYYPFGAPMWERSFSSSSYRYGFNGQEKEDEVKGGGNSYTALFWEYDGRLGKRWNLDPVVKPWESLYACLNDNPIRNIDPNGDNGWHPEEVGLGTGVQKLVADDGDIDANTGKVDQIKLQNYLDKTVGQGNYSQQQFDFWIRDAECEFGANDFNPSSVSLYSSNGQFDNLVGKYLVNKQSSDPSWGVTNYKGNNCSPTTFNRVDKAIEFVFGNDYLGKLAVNNPIYNAWQGNPTTGYNSEELYGPNVADRLGFGSIVTKDDIMAGTLKAGAIVSLDQRPGINGEDVSWHAAIFLNYNYDKNDNIIGFTYWHHWTYSNGILKNTYTSQSIFNYNNQGKYSSKGYKPMKGLNFN